MSAQTTKTIQMGEQIFAALAAQGHALSRRHIRELLHLPPSHTGEIGAGLNYLLGRHRIQQWAPPIAEGKTKSFGFYWIPGVNVPPNGFAPALGPDVAHNSAPIPLDALPKMRPAQSKSAMLNGSLIVPRQKLGALLDAFLDNVDKPMSNDVQALVLEMREMLQK